MLPLLVAVIVLVVFEVVAWRYAADSRDGNDWTMIVPTPRDGPHV